MKNNKNAFTLIELLAVIVILGILMIAAIPAISNAITKSRKDTYVTNSKKIIDAVRISMASGETKLEANNAICQYPAPNQYTRINLTSGGTNDILPYLLERGGDRSSFGQTYTGGYVFIYNKGTAESETTEATDYYDYYISLVDAGGNGISTPVLEDKLVRGNIQTSQANLSATALLKGAQPQYTCNIKK